MEGTQSPGLNPSKAQTRARRKHPTALLRKGARYRFDDWPSAPAIDVGALVTFEHLPSGVETGKPNALFV